MLLGDVTLIYIIVLIIIFKVNKKKKSQQESQTQEEKDKYYDKLTELQRLKSQNIITNEEFEGEKGKIQPFIKETNIKIDTMKENNIYLIVCSIMLILYSLFSFVRNNNPNSIITAIFLIIAYTIIVTFILGIKRAYLLKKEIGKAKGIVTFVIIFIVVFLFNRIVRS